MVDGTEPVADDEILYRRVPISPEYFNPQASEHPTPLAFNPHKKDTTGLSVYRAKYKTAEQVAKNDRGKSYYVAEMKVKDLRVHKLRVEPKPIQPDDRGHAELPDLTYAARHSNRAEEIKVLLATRLCTIAGFHEAPKPNPPQA